MSLLAQEEEVPAGTVPIASLKLGESPRLAGENSAHVHMLANLEADLPAITVHWPTMRVIDGMHRLRAAIVRGAETMDVRFVRCDEADIFAAAVAANIRHGLPLSLADRESAAARIVQTHPQWSNRRIAAETGLSHRTVAVIRNRATGDSPQLHHREGRDGRVRPLHTTDRRLAAADFMARNPAASLRQVAEAIGLSAGTVRDVKTRLARGEDPAARHVQPGRAAAELRRRGAAATRPAPVTGMSAPRSPAPDVTAILHSLSKDPAIRLTDTGREVLRLLRTCAMCAEKLDTLTADIPPHRAASVADLAKANARFWMSLAAQLAQDSSLN